MHHSIQHSRLDDWPSDLVIFLYHTPDFKALQTRVMQGTLVTDFYGERFRTRCVVFDSGFGLVRNGFEREASLRRLLCILRNIEGMARHPGLFLWFGLWAVCLLSSSVGWTQVTTQIVPDGSLGTTVTSAANTHTITGGTRPTNGPNLFHSFGKFSIGQGDVANFQNETQLPTSNILSRVTGGDPSNIFGTIKSTDFGKANLFLMNPAGIVFGRNAKLDVGGAFHATTADFLRMQDGNQFFANLGEDSVLSVAPVEAFGFLSENPQGIAIDESRLAVSEGGTISIIGGEIEMTGAPFFTGFIEIPTLDAPGGRINVASVASPGEVVVNQPGDPPKLDVDTFQELGTINLIEDARIETSSDQGSGTVMIRGGNLLVAKKSFIFSDVDGDVDGAPVGIDIEVRDKLVVSEGGRITAESDFLTAGTPGDLRIKAGTIEVTGGEELDRRSSIASRLFPGTTGDGANIDIETGKLLIAGQAEISTRTSGSGEPGELRLNVDSIEIRDGGRIDSTTEGPERGGNILLTTVQSVTLAGPESGIFSMNDRFSSGPGGEIAVTAEGLVIQDQAVISARSEGFGKAGAIRVTVSENLTMLTGGTFDSSTVGLAEAGTVEITAPALTLDGSRVTTTTEGQGNAGDIVINVGRLDLVNAGEISSNSTGQASGNAGTITVQGIGGPETFATDVTISSAQMSTLAEATGAGGAIKVSAGNIGLVDATVSATVNDTAAATDDPGAPADITMNSSEVVMSGGNVSAATTGERDAGSVTLNLGGLSATGQANITSSSSGSGSAGTVTVRGEAGTVGSQAETIRVTDSTISTAASETGAGGTIAMGASSVLTLEEATLSATVNNGAEEDPDSSTGNIVLTAPTVMVTGGSVTAETQGTRNAGAITVNVSNLETQGGNARALISSSSTGDASGNAGRVTVQGATGTVGSKAETLTLVDTTVSTTAEGTGAGGSILLGASEQITLNNSIISATANNGTEGPSGNVTLMTPVLIVLGGSMEAQTTGTRQAGNVTLSVGMLKANTWEPGLPAPEPSPIRISSSSTGNAAGDAGNVTIHGSNGEGTMADTVALNSVVLSTVAEGTGAGGSIDVNAENTIELTDTTISATVNNTPPGADPSADTADIDLRTIDLHMMGSTISAETTGTREAGTITLNVANFYAAATSQISSSSTGGAKGNAGNVTVQGFSGEGSLAPVQLFNSAFLTSAEGSGKGGNINVQTETLTLDDARIAATANTGAGGSIEITSDSSIHLTQAEISAAVEGGKQTGGSISLAAVEDIVLAESSSVSAKSDGQGDAGDIGLLSGRNIFLQNSEITTEATREGAASGGNISLSGPRRVELKRSAIVANVTGGVGGNVTVGMGRKAPGNPRFVILDKSQITAKAGEGTGGNIDIFSHVFLSQPSQMMLANSEKVLDASSDTGIDGIVNIASPITNLVGALAPLPETFLSGAELLREPCARRYEQGKVNSLVQGGRDGLPPAPGNVLPSPIFGVDDSPNYQQTQAPPLLTSRWIVPAWQLPQLGFEKGRSGRGCRTN